LDGISPASLRSGIAARPSAAIIEVSGLSKRYGEQVAIADICFVASAGQILGIIGPNGAGKTTLLETLVGLLPADSGAVCLDGQDVSPLRRRQSMFYVPDEVRPYQDQFVGQVLMFFGAVYRRPPAGIAQIIATLELQPVLGKRVHALSKGYRRRLLLALGLLAPHPILLMDEPFDGFDLRQTRQMAPLLRREADNGRALLLSIHQLPHAERICDRFILLAAGRNCGSGTLDELRDRTGLPQANLEEVFLALT